MSFSVSLKLEAMGETSHQRGNLAEREVKPGRRVRNGRTMEKGKWKTGRGNLVN